MKICIGIPVLDNVDYRFFLATSANIGVWSRKHKLFLDTPNRCAIDRAREIIVRDAIEAKCDYILFIDDDTLLPEDTLDQLLPIFEKDESIIAVSGFCFQRGYKYMPMVYKYERQFGIGSCQMIDPWPEEPFEVHAVGMGVCMLKVDLLAKISEPCFGRDGPGTEDFYFFRKAHQAGYKTYVNPKVEAIHIGERILVGSKNVNDLRRADHKVMYLAEECGGRAQKVVVEL